MGKEVKTDVDLVSIPVTVQIGYNSLHSSSCQYNDRPTDRPTAGRKTQIHPVVHGSGFLYTTACWGK